MTNRILSMDKHFIEVVNFFQKYSIGLLHTKDVYKWFCDTLPRGKRYNKYIKKQSATYPEWLVSVIAQHYECSKKDVDQYIDLFVMSPHGQQQLQELVSLYGIEPKKLKQLKTLCRE